MPGSEGESDFWHPSGLERTEQVPTASWAAASPTLSRSATKPPTSAKEVISQALTSFGGYPPFWGTLVVHSVEADLTTACGYASPSSG
jgi:hypothetical protein